MFIKVDHEVRSLLSYSIKVRFNDKLITIIEFFGVLVIISADDLVKLDISHVFFRELGIQDEDITILIHVSFLLFLVFIGETIPCFGEIYLLRCIEVFRVISADTWDLFLSTIVFNEEVEELFLV